MLADLFSRSGINGDFEEVYVVDSKGIIEHALESCIVGKNIFEVSDPVKHKTITFYFALSKVRQNTEFEIENKHYKVQHDKGKLWVIVNKIKLLYPKVSAVLFCLLLSDFFRQM